MTRITPIDPTTDTGETATGLDTARALFAMFAHLSPDVPATLATTPRSMTRRAP